MRRRSIQGSQAFALSAWLIAACASSGPAPEVPSPTAGMGGNGGGSAGMGGMNADSGMGGGGGLDSGGGSGGITSGGIGGMGGASGIGGFGAGEGGNGGTIGAGQGGSGGAGPFYPCSDSDSLDDELVGAGEATSLPPFDEEQTFVKGSAEDIKEIHSDYCEDDDTLIEYSCDVVAVPCTEGAASADAATCEPSFELGEVTSHTVACANGCEDSACRRP